MLYYNDAMPSTGAYKASPLTVAEIDRHLDGDRIWAIILAMRIEAQDYVHDLFSQDPPIIRAPKSAREQPAYRWPGVA